MAMEIMQGDSYGIPITIEFDGGIGTPENLEDVEVVICEIKKTYKEGTLVYDNLTQQYVFPLTQAESFAMATSFGRGQIRIKTVGGDVIGQSLDSIDIKKSTSKVVL